MQVKHQVSRGLERLMARRAAVMLGEHFGLAGLGSCDNFPALESALDEAGIRDARQSVDSLRSMHRCGCQRVMNALPVAVSAMRLQEAGGEAALAGIFDKVKKAVKKIGKSAAKLSLSHQLIKKVAPKAIKFSPSQIVMSAASAKKAKLTAEQAAARAANKQAKKDAKAAKKAAKAAAKAAAALAAAGAQNLSPVEAGAAVLANQSGLNIQTPEGEAFAQQAVQSAGGGGGGAMPMESMYDAPPTGDDGMIFGMPPLLVAGMATAGVGILWLAFGGKKRN